MHSPEEFDIRYTEGGDLDFLQSWFNDPRERDPFPFEKDFETHGSLKNWIGFAKFQSSLTGLIKEVPCAVATLFLMPYRKVSHRASFYLYVEQKHRRKGVGRSMLRNLIHLGKTQFRLESIHAEFYEPNVSFRTLLEKQGFRSLAHQEHFFKMNGTYLPRVMMERSLDE